MLKTVLLLVLPALCLAQTQPEWADMAHDIFDHVDLNGNGAWNRVELDAFFQLFDRNHDGDIPFNEFKNALDAMNSYFIGHEQEWYQGFDVDKDNSLTHMDFNLAFNIYDLNSDGLVMLAEYEQALGLTKRPDWFVIVHDLFDAVDVNGNGEWTRPEMEAYFHLFDRNHDGDITYNEFANAIDAQASYFIGHEQEWYDNFDVNKDKQLNHIDFNSAFLIYDHNSDGVVTLQEYETALGISNTQGGNGDYDWSVIVNDFFNAIDANGNDVWTRIELDGYFQLFDANRDGDISYDEFSTAIDAQGSYFIGHEQEWYQQFDVNKDGQLNHIDFNYAFLQYDGNSDGLVTRDEYYKFLGQQAPQEAPSWSVIAHDIFEAIDTNDNGAWTRIEMDAFFQLFDANRDGTITFDEFSTAIDAQADYFIGHEQEFYTAFDANHDNVLNRIDFNYRFLQYDLNSNGLVTLDEFDQALATMQNNN